MGQIVRSSLSVFVFKIYSLKTPYQRSTSLIQPDYFRVENYTRLHKSCRIDADL